MKGHYNHNDKIVFDTHAIVALPRASLASLDKTQWLTEEICRRKRQLRSNTSKFQLESTKTVEAFPQINTYSVKELLHQDNRSRSKCTNTDVPASGQHSQCSQSSVGVAPNSATSSIRTSDDPNPEASLLIPLQAANADAVEAQRVRSGGGMVKVKFPVYERVDGKKRATQKMILATALRGLSKEKGEFAYNRFQMETIVSYNGTLNAESVFSSMGATESKATDWGHRIQLQKGHRHRHHHHNARPQEIDQQPNPQARPTTAPVMTTVTASNAATSSSLVATTLEGEEDSGCSSGERRENLRLRARAGVLGSSGPLPSRPGTGSTSSGIQRGQRGSTAPRNGDGRSVAALSVAGTNISSSSRPTKSAGGRQR